MNAYYKNVYLILIAVILLFNLTTCKQDELGEIGFPRIKTLVVEMVSDTGAVFKGEIVDIPLGCEVIDHGFVWSESKDATEYMEKVSLGKVYSKGNFSATANRAMVEGKKYYFKAFIQTSTTTIYGNELDFVSLGSHKPIIYSITPDSGSWLDTIIVRGKYFSNNAYAMNVYFNNTPAPNFGGSDSLIKITVPLNVDTAISKIAIRYNNIIYPSDKKFNLVPNVSITSIEPKSGSWNSIVKIRGRNLQSAQIVSFNKANAYARSKSDSLIEVFVPTTLDSINSIVSVNINNHQFKAPQKFMLTPSTIISTTPKTILKGYTVNVKGKNFRKINTKVKLGQTDIPITAISDSLIKFEMPACSPDGNKQFTIDDGLFKYTTENIEYITPGALDFMPKTCTWGDTITITGRGLNYLSNLRVSLSNYNSSYNKTYVNVFSKTENSFKIIVPKEIENYRLRINIEDGNTYINYLSELRMLAPLINEIIYDKNNTSQPIIIKGKYFHPTKSTVRIYNSSISSSLEQTTCTNTEIKCKYPNVLSGNYDLSVRVDFPNEVSQSNTVASEFITAFKKFFETNVDISPNMFFYYNNQAFLFYGWTSNGRTLYKLEMNSKTFSTVNNPYPYLVNSAIFQINSKGYFCTGDTVSTFGYTSKSKACYSYDITQNKWERLPFFPGEARNDAIGFSIGSKGYLLGGQTNYSYNNELWEFDSNTNSWTKKLNTSLNFSRTTDVFVYNNEAYILNGAELWKYNPDLNSIVKISDFPGGYIYSNSAFFCYGQKAYQLRNEGLWEYNIQTNVWKKTINPVLGVSSFNHSFYYNNKIYLQYFNRIYELDPSLL